MAKMKTADVKALVDEVIASLPHLKNEHVILTVFQEIEGNSAWLSQYRILCNALNKQVVNQSIGRWTLRALGAESIKQVSAKGTTLTQTYSTLCFR